MPNNNNFNLGPPVRQPSKYPINFIGALVLIVLAMIGCWHATGSPINPVIPETVTGDERNYKLYIVRFALASFCIAIILFVRGLLYR